MKKRYFDKKKANFGQKSKFAKNVEICPNIEIFLNIATCRSPLVNAVFAKYTTES